MTRYSLLPLICMGFLAGCAVNDGSDEGAFYNAGYTDGCRTGQSLQGSFTSKVYRDDVRFDGEPSYRAGWRAGYAQCNTGDNDFDNRPGDLGEWETY